MVRIGLLGCGFLATFYMQGLAEVPNQQVTIVYGRDKRKAADFASRWNIPRSSDAMPAVAADKGSRHFSLPESPLSLVSCLLKRLTPLPGSHFWARY